MQIQDNALREYLKNVYFLTGTPCAGKSTAARALGRRHGLRVYDADERFSAHQRLSSPALQPAMNQRFASADEFFGRSVREYGQWLRDSARQQLDFVLLDLVRLSGDRPVLCDCQLTLEEADRLSDPSRVAFLIREPSRLAADYCDRPDHADFDRFLKSASSPEDAYRKLDETLQSLNRPYWEQIKASRYFYLERTDQSTVEDTVARLERHFGL